MHAICEGGDASGAGANLAAAFMRGGELARRALTALGRAGADCPGSHADALTLLAALSCKLTHVPLTCWPWR